MIAPTESAPVGEVLGGAFLSPKTKTSGRWRGRVPQPALSLPDDALLTLTKPAEMARDSHRWSFF